MPGPPFPPRSGGSLNLPANKMNALAFILHGFEREVVKRAQHFETGFTEEAGQKRGGINPLGMHLDVFLEASVTLKKQGHFRIADFGDHVIFIFPDIRRFLEIFRERESGEIVQQVVFSRDIEDESAGRPEMPVHILETTLDALLGQ